MIFKPFINIKKNKEKLIDCRNQKKIITLYCRVAENGRLGLMCNGKFSMYVILFILGKGSKFVIKNTYGKLFRIKVLYKSEKK